MASLQYSLQIVFSVVLCVIFFMLLSHAVEKSDTLNTVKSIFSLEKGADSLPTIQEGADGKTLNMPHEGENVEIPLLDEKMVEKLDFGQ